VLAGVAMRDYEGTLDAVCDGYGVQKSSVSRHWQAVSAQRLREFLERPLGELDLVVLMIDGIEFHHFLLVVALGLDSQGKKHVLGGWRFIERGEDLLVWANCLAQVAKHQVQKLTRVDTPPPPSRLS
jgi:hypothetical protein